MSKPDVPAREHPVFYTRSRACATAPRRSSPKATAQYPAPPGCKKTQSPYTGETHTKAKKLNQGESRRPIPGIYHMHPSTTALSNTPRPLAPPRG